MIKPIRSISEPLTPLFERYLNAIVREPRRCVDFLVGLNARLARDVKYLIRLEPGVQTPEETLAKGRDRAATPAGSWSSFCAIWAWPLALSRVI